jgi:hypothetical protein
VESPALTIIRWQLPGIIFFGNGFEIEVNAGEAILFNSAPTWFHLELNILAISASLKCQPLNADQ